jgi:hypothetical protein
MILCQKCVHYYITWDKKYPYGCRAMRFKSHEPPSKVVSKSSGIECLKFKAKEKLTKK